MEFLEIFNCSWDSLGPQVRNFSARTSSCSDLELELRCSPEFLITAKDALAVLAVLPLVTNGVRNYFQIESLRNHIATMANQYRYQGEWDVVGSLLQTSNSLQVYDTWKVIMSNMNEFDWFGNFLPRMKRAVKALTWKPRYVSVVEDTRRVKAPQRKRGYDDKGSRRDSHKWTPGKPLKQEKELLRPVKEPPAFAWFGVQRWRRSE